MEKSIVNIQRFYLDWVNNFLTVKALADHYDITKKEAEILIEAGRKLNNRF
jgi:hypothetical protein